MTHEVSVSVGVAVEHPDGAIEPIPHGGAHWSCLTCGAGGIADDHRRATEAALEHRAETAQPWPADIQVTSWLPISQADLHPRPSEGNQ